MNNAKRSCLILRTLSNRAREGDGYLQVVHHDTVVADVELSTAHEKLDFQKVASATQDEMRKEFKRFVLDKFELTSRSKTRVPYTKSSSRRITVERARQNSRPRTATADKNVASLVYLTELLDHRWMRVVPRLDERIPNEQL